MVVYPPSPLPLNTRRSHPRFLVPHCKRERDHKRPLVVYTEILNALTDSEWKALKLPSPFDLIPRPNVQLPDLLDPLSCLRHVRDPVTRGTSGVGSHVAGGVNPIEAQVSSLVNGGVLDQLTGGSIVSDGDVHAQVSDEGLSCVLPPSSNVLHDPTRQCHKVCFPSLGGEVICLYEDVCGVPSDGVPNDEVNDVPVCLTT